MAASQKVVLSKVPEMRSGKAGTYKVEKLVNRIEPAIGSEIDKKEVERLIGDANIRVEIVPPRN